MIEDPFTPAFFRRLQQLKIRTRRSFLGSRQGIHLSARRGHGLEFSDYRAYAPGDDFRHIDWNTYARTDRLFVRQYREEQDLNLLVLLDSSKSMSFPEDNTKSDLARYIALALSYVALVSGDTVSIARLGEIRGPHYRGAKSFARLRKSLMEWRPNSVFRLQDEVRSAVFRERTSGKAFLISDLYVEPDELRESLAILRSKNYDITVFHVLSPAELALSLPLDTSVVVDSETGATTDLDLAGISVREYAHLLAEHVHSLETYCKAAETSYVLVSSEHDFSDFVLSKLPQLGILK